MKLTVANKVILGFGVIALLLLIASLSSLWSFNTISNSSSRVNDIAVPAQQQSNYAQIQLLKLAKLSALAFTAEQIDDINKYQTDFNLAEESFNVNAKKLSALLKDDASLNKPLKDALAHAETYSQSVDAMFTAKKQVVEGSKATAAELDKLIKMIDEAGATLLDITYIEEPDQKATLELIGGAAGRVDGQLLSLMQTVKETAAYTEPEQLKDSLQNIEFTLNDMQGNLDYIGNLVGKVGAEDLWQTFNEQMAAIKAQGSAANNLVSLKTTQLNALQQARQELAKSEQAVGQAVTSLDLLLDGAGKQFNNLQAEVSSSVSFAKVRTWVLMIVLVGLAIGIAYKTITSMLRPLGSINKVLGEVAAGDLTHRLKIVNDDEFGALSAKVNSLIEALSQLIRQISNNAVELGQSSSQSRGEVLEISEALSQQQQQINSVNDTTQLLANSTHDIADQAALAVSEMQGALQQSQQIDHISSENNKLISGLAVQLTETADIMLKVNDQSKNIGGILATIRGIAEQTNLLALNAAIEAARAGEQGRGFAVVADEVRSLAVRSQTAVDEIRTMIQTLQQQSTAAVNAITRGRTDAEYCVGHTEELVTSLSHVNEAISHMHDISTTIASATQQQLAMGEVIQQNMQQMVELSDQSADKANKTLEHSQAVAISAEHLQNSICTFKI
jgi:methyl-accepting chemotaxis protein